MKIETHINQFYKPKETPTLAGRHRLIHWYNLAGYYTLIIPFKLKKRYDGKGWENDVFMFQKLLCLVIWWPLSWVICVFEILTVLVSFFTENNQPKIGHPVTNRPGTKGTWDYDDSATYNKAYFVNENYITENTGPEICQPEKYFEFAYLILHLALQVKFYLVVMRKRKQLEKLFNDVSAFSLFQPTESSGPLKSKSFKWTTMLLRLYMAYMHVACIALAILRKLYFGQTIQTNIPLGKQFSTAIETGRNRFFVGHKISCAVKLYKDNICDNIYSTENIIIGSVELALQFIRIWNDLFVSMFFFGALPLTFWSASKRFQLYCSGIYRSRAGSPILNKAFNSQQADLIVEKYEQLRNLVISLNSVWSTPALLFVLDTLLTVVLRVTLALTSKNTWHLLYTGNLALFLIVLLVMLAEGRIINAAFKQWLCDRYIREQVFGQKKDLLEWLEKDLDARPVGIGSVGVYEVRNDQLEKVFVQRVRAENTSVVIYVKDIDKENESPSAQKRFHLFHWYFLAGYYTLFVPFKIRKRRNGIGWETKSFTVQKWFSLLIWWPLALVFGITDLIGRLKVFYGSRGNKGNTGAWHYFDIADFIFSQALPLTFYWILVSKIEKLERLFDDVSAFSLFHPTEHLVPPSTRLSKWKKWFLNAYMLYVVFASILLMVVMRFAYKFSLQATIVSGRERFFLGDMERRVALVNESSPLDTDDMYSIENIVVASVELVLKIICFCNEAYTIMLFNVVLPVTFWYASKRFQLYISGIYTPRAGSPPLNTTNNSLHADRVFQKHEELRNLVTSLNSIWSTSILYYMFGILLGIVINLNEVIASGNILEIFQTVNLLLFYLVSLVLMAEGRRMNASMKLWLWDRHIREQVFAQRKADLEWLERYLDIGQVGIGNLGTYEISYGFLIQMLVFTVTVFLITF
ncbi:unnamed protein product [Orchesella dallaii]|uniref:Uncharacterized protein n=1 Tax=Orchesella dallaii TaxID=48710 RepID=A0ABP1RP13_9HEXA